MDRAPEEGRFAGRTVIVAGAGSGIGKATALQLIVEGATVVAADLVPDRLDELADAELADDLERGVQESALRTVVGDIAHRETVARIVDAARGRVDGLANVANATDGFLPPAEVDDATWDRVMGVNLTGPMRLTRAVLPIMLEAGGGAIVNIAAEAPPWASVAGAAYTASRYAIAGYTKSVAFYYGPQGVRANAVAPGQVEGSVDESRRSESAARRAEAVTRAAMPPPSPPEGLAAAVLWLLSDDSANVNGVVLPSDGGWPTA